MNKLQPSGPSCVPYGNRYCAIDIGTANFALRIEDREDYVYGECGKISSVVNDTKNFGKKGKNNIYVEIVPNLLKYLESQKSILRTCAVVIIELQINEAQMSRIEGLTVGYLCSILSPLSEVVVMGTSVKNKLIKKHFGLEGRLKREDAKKYGVELAQIIIEKDEFKLKKNKTHIADTILMIECYVREIN